MKKKLIIVSFVLCFVLIFTSCLDKSIDNTDGQDGTHEYEIGETSGYIVKNGVTDYSIVIPADSNAVINIAAEELQNFFKEATGIELPIINDSGISYSENVKYLSIGDNRLLKSAGITIDKEKLGSDGLRITTKGNSIFMFGGGDYGSLYSVYEYLHQALSFEFYFKDCYTLDKNVTELKLMNYNITDIPDISQRPINYGFIEEDIRACYRYRTKPNKDFFIEVGGKTLHNSFFYLPKVTYEGSHPNFYSLDGEQLCYTARGDSDEYELMVNTVANIIIQKRKEFPSKNIITLTTEDNNECCTCDACSDIEDKYSTITATVIIFLNDVNDKVQNWFDTEEGQQYDRNLDILFFAYRKYASAPAKENKVTKEYEPIDNLKCSDNVCVWYAPINSTFTRSLYDKSNATTYNTMKAWKAVSKKLYLWLYSTNFSFYLVPYNCFNGMQDNYKMASKMGAEYLLNQAQGGQQGAATGWCLLKAYLNAKLAWNCYSDYQQLVDNFFSAMYGDAAPYMRDYFERFKTLATFNEELNGFSGGVYFNALDSKFWPKRELLVWKNYINQSLQAIDYLKNKNINLYNSCYKHIIAERVSINYMLVQLYDNNISPDEIMDLKLQFKDDVTLLNMTLSKEGGYITNLYSAWGI